MSQCCIIDTGEMSTPIITSQTTIAEITKLLSQCGCPDITRYLDLPNCSQWRVNGGGQGDIHEGALVDGVRVAIKISRGDQSIDLSKGDKSFKRVAQELYTWFTLSHPNIAELLGMAVFQGRIAMISPWITPGDFYKFIDRFPEADRMDLCLQVANGLTYLHEHNVVFGDLKAQNVLIGSDGIAKLTDFGLSILEQSHILFSTTSTTGGGSGRWMAPELIKSSTERSYEADVYALAMTFIEILTDKVPFPDIHNEAKVMYSVLYEKNVPSCPERLKVESLRHQQWWRLLIRCWCPQPGGRPRAVDWLLMDRYVKTQRTQYLAEQLEYALCYGRTKLGSFGNLDTGEDLSLTNSTTTTFFVSNFVAVNSGSENRMQSKEATLRALMSHYASTTNDTRQPDLDATCVKNLQDLIYNGLEERIQQVRHWITINVTKSSPQNQDVNNIFGRLDSLAFKMKEAARICATKCSNCTQLCLHVHGHAGSKHRCPDHTPRSTNHLKRPKPSNLYTRMAVEDAARCIRVQAFDHVLMGQWLPSRDAIVLGIEWQRGWYLPHESLVLLVYEKGWSNHGIWWIRLARFLSHDFITPHRHACPVQRPSSVVHADKEFIQGLAFGHVAKVIYSLHQTMNDYSDLEMDSWFYAATVFRLLTSQEKFPPTWSEKTLTYEDHPTANRVQHERFQEIFSRVEQILQSEGTMSHVEAFEPPNPSPQVSATSRNLRVGRSRLRAAYTLTPRTPRTSAPQRWNKLKNQLNSSSHQNASSLEELNEPAGFVEKSRVPHECGWTAEL
ncbi:hypothetical protein FRC12_016609 [Ceratobasidium sp. 428]|nr:hypothetical protein FRC12_016609 [Ceratobasidium sp. 428]